MTVVNYFLDCSCRLIRLLFLCSSEVNNYVWKFKFNKVVVTRLVTCT